MARPELTPVIALIALACLTGCGAPPRSDRSDADRSRLVAAVGERRMLAGRAMGGFRFSAESGTPRGPSRSQTPFEILQVAAEIRKRFEADPSPANTGNLAIAHLLTGDAENGVRLAELRTLSDETADSLTDLSAAFLERATTGGNIDDFARALDTALRALRIQPASREALFNRARAAEGLRLPWLARVAWEEYLAIESERPWAAFARDALSRASEAESQNNVMAAERPEIIEAWRTGKRNTVRDIASRRPDLAREILRRDVLPDVARGILDRRPEPSLLGFAHELNEIAEKTDRDTLDREALALLSRGDPELAAAHIQFAQASLHLDERRVQQGAAGVLAARAVFFRKGSPYAAQAELQAALIDFYAGNRDGLAARYALLIDRHQDRHPLLVAVAHWMRGLCLELETSNGWEAAGHYRTAHALLSEAGQRDASRKVGSLLFGALVGLGREADARRVLADVVRSLSLEDVPVRTNSVIEGLSANLQDLGLSSAALEVVTQGLKGRRGGPMEQTTAALDVAQLAHLAGDSQAVAASLASALRSLEGIKDRDVRAELEISYGQTRLATDPRAGATSALATRLLGGLRERRNETSLMNTLAVMGEKAVAAGLPTQAEAWLREAVSMHLAAARLPAEDFERSRVFEAAKRPADALIGLLFSTGRAEEALVLMEGLRAREEPALRDLRGTIAPLPEGVTLLNYWTLKDRILATVLSSEGTFHASLPVVPVAVQRSMRQLESAVEVSSQAHVAESLATLHQGLVAPLEGWLRRTRRLVIIADRSLWDVPFAGLASGSTQPPLSARYELSFSGSIARAARVRQDWTTPESVLAVGGVAWNPEVFPNLRSLPESRGEAQDVAGLYGRSRLLAGADATATTVQRLAPEFDVVHIASHAVTNPREPGDSFLLLTAAGREAGAWRARDQGWSAFSAARLIVLSACGAASQHRGFVGAEAGLLRSIQRATTAEVLASVGPVDDLASRHLLRNFHAYLRDGHTPAAALRLAQMDSRKNAAGVTWMLYRIVL